MTQRRTDLEAGMDDIRRSPSDRGRVELIVRRPQVGEREALAEGELDVVLGLTGDNWPTRGRSRARNASAHPEKQITIMNARVIALLAGGKERWPLAGDQLFIDFDLSASNVPPGTQLQIGSAVIEATASPHTGCHKFVARFGADAGALVNSPLGLQLNLRGINGRVVQGGKVHVGDPVTKIASL